MKAWHNTDKLTSLLGASYQLVFRRCFFNSWLFFIRKNAKPSGTAMSCFGSSNLTVVVATRNWTNEKEKKERKVFWSSGTFEQTDRCSTTSKEALLPLLLRQMGPRSIYGWIGNAAATAPFFVFCSFLGECIEKRRTFCKDLFHSNTHSHSFNAHTLAPTIATPFLTRSCRNHLSHIFALEVTFSTSGPPFLLSTSLSPPPPPHSKVG